MKLTIFIVRFVISLVKKWRINYSLTADLRKLAYWNDELSTLWKNMHDKEKLFLKTNNKNRRQFYRADFLSAQKTFDERLRYFERKYRTELPINIEKTRTSNPRKFWEELKKLGPKKKPNIPMECYTEDGGITSNTLEMLKNWELDFSKLYNHSENDFDAEFYNEALKQKQIIEDNMMDPAYIPNRLLNKEWQACCRGL